MFNRCPLCTYHCWGWVVLRKALTSDLAVFWKDKYTLDTIWARAVFIEENISESFWILYRITVPEEHSRTSHLVTVSHCYYEIALLLLLRCAFLYLLYFATDSWPVILSFFFFSFWAIYIGFLTWNQNFDTLPSHAHTGTHREFVASRTLLYS